MNTWWDRNFKEERFRNYLGGVEADSRVALSNIISGYKSVLDCACGICLDWEKYKKEKIEIEYTGIDNCGGLIEEAQERGINAIVGNIEDLPFEDNSFEVVTGRHILEHLPGFEKAIKEMYRVAQKEVIIIFFLPPTKEEKIGKAANLNNEVHLNTYSKQKIDNFISKFAKYEWKKVKREVILRIFK